MTDPGSTVPTDAMQQRVAAVSEALGVGVCSFYLAHPDKQSLEMVATCGLDRRILGTRLDYSQGLTGKVARTGKAVAARDIQSHADYFHVEDSGEERFTSYLGIPLERNGDLLGVLVIQTVESKTFFHRDIRELHSAGRDLIQALLTPCTEI